MPGAGSATGICRVIAGYLISPDGQNQQWAKTPRNVKNTISDVAARVKKIVVEHLGVDEEKVVEGASFIDDLGAHRLPVAPALQIYA